MPLTWCCHPTEKHIQAVSFIYDRKRWQILDPAIEPDLAYLDTVADGDVEIVSRTLADDFWVVLVSRRRRSRAVLPVRPTAAGGPFFVYQPPGACEGLPLVTCIRWSIRSRDGLDWSSYYSLPLGAGFEMTTVFRTSLAAGVDPTRWPLVSGLLGLQPLHQWLANRGYAVLPSTSASSIGFGKALHQCGQPGSGAEKSWRINSTPFTGRSRQGSPTRLGWPIMGGSFGGYSTLAGLTFTPDVFACGVDVVGPSSLVTLLESMPPYWKSVLEQFTTRVGDHRTERGTRPAHRSIPR